MDDNNAEFVFNEDTAEKAVIARSSHAKGKRAKVPWNNFTKKEMHALNGKVKSYNLSRPMTWAEFQEMPDDLQRKYVAFLTDHGGNTALIAKMLAVPYSTLKVKRRKLGIPAKRGYTGDAKRWYAWLEGTETETGTPSEEPDEVIAVEDPVAEPPASAFRDTASGSFKLTCTCDELYSFLRESVGNGVREYLITFQSVKGNRTNEN